MVRNSASIIANVGVGSAFAVAIALSALPSENAEIALGCLLLMLALAWVSARRHHRVAVPLRNLSELVCRISESHDYALRAVVSQTDEFSVLATSLNAMLNAIEQRDRQRQQDMTRNIYELERKSRDLSNEISERTTTQVLLVHAEQRFQSAFESAAIGMILIDRGRQLQHVNQAFADMLGYQRDELNRKYIRELSHPDDIGIGVEQYERLLAGTAENYQIEKRYMHQDGHAIWALCSVSAVRKANGDYDYALAQVQDITAAHQLSRELSYQATHDSLTGLVNRREFEARIEHALERTWRSGKEHAVCYLDLDQFKVINDTCGHVAGDELLRQIASVLSSHMRASDTVARLGGDEFGLLMEGCGLLQSQRVADNIRTAIEDFQFVWDDKRFRVGASVGLVPINTESSSVTEVLQQADTACYAAKDLGRNRVHVFSRDDVELAKRHGEMQWVNKIQNALEKNQFRLYVQPIVPVQRSARHYEHYEVLIRMIDDSGSEIPPGAFLPAAERYNLAGQIDRWVVSGLLDWLADNPLERARIDMISVNLSGLTLADESFLSYVIERLRTTRVPSTKLCFEITETAVISNLSMATHFIKTLKELGCQFALDDFGSGLSSFAYLKNLPVDYLKIDGMFVRDIHIDPIDRALVRSINDVGKVMGKKTIAEFVENDAIMRVLADLGIDFAQGYGVGKPFALDTLVSTMPALAANQ